MADELTLAEGDDLEAAIAEAAEGTVLVLDAGDFDGGITIRKNLEIRGNGEARLVGTRGSVLRVIGEGVVLTLQGLVLTEGKSELGGAVHLVDGASLVARNCRFDSNVAKHKGGAIYLADGRCELSSCELVDNRAGSGGAIYADGLATLVIDGGRITGNDASTGAGVHVGDGAEAIVTGAHFEGQGGDGLDVSVAGSTSRAPIVAVRSSTIGATSSRPESALTIEG
jgi:predicted outer membrane repeat protein